MWVAPRCAARTGTRRAYNRPLSLPEALASAFLTEVGMEPSTVSRRYALGLIGATTAGAVGAPLLGPAAARAGGGTGVTLVDNGTTVTLANGLLSLTVNKTTGQIPTMQLIGSRYG